MRRKNDIQIIEPGLFSTVQDCGRSNVGAYGVSPSGYADWFSARVANKLVANPQNAALLETTLSGITFSVGRATRVAVTGAEAAVRVNAQPAHPWETIQLRAGDHVELQTAQRGVRSYVAFAGGIRVESALGSVSTDITAGFGGLHGGTLKAGDTLQLNEVDEPSGSSEHRSFGLERRPAWHAHARVRTLPGPHAENIAGGPRHLTQAALTFRVTPQCNRQGIRLQGNPIAGRHGWDVLSFGVCTGCVQISNDGQPIVLLSDHQTTGGYGVPLIVITADIPVVAQLRPGDHVTFQAVNQVEAAKAFVEQIHAVAQIASLPASVRK